ncbi:transposase [Streptomyces sp. NBC_01381]|uniref:transposase n=1 Tax=Streptomyces sp. NBC_01381 TaxID=2903845 RepID=UPI002252A943|nr:transposase [Streptomyces sp. NBC_01381]MCX4671222.1 transposase [Streptomyces sp. NBC_01381]
MVLNGTSTRPPAHAASPVRPGTTLNSTADCTTRRSSPRKACRACPDRLSCTGKPAVEAATYVLRAGCEATVSETVHAHGLRHCRYRGLAKTHVKHILTAAGADLIRLSEYVLPGT